MCFIVFLAFLRFPNISVLSVFSIFPPGTKKTLQLRRPNLPTKIPVFCDFSVVFNVPKTCLFCESEEPQLRLVHNQGYVKSKGSPKQFLTKWPKKRLSPNNLQMWLAPQKSSHLQDQRRLLHEHTRICLAGCNGIQVNICR